MTTTTMTQWVDAFQALTVSGVTRHYDYPPLSLNTSDLPAAWPGPFGSNKSRDDFTCVGLNWSRQIEYTIAVEAVGQSTQPTNYDALVTMADALETALKAMAVTTFIDPVINMGIRSVAGVDYWALVADVTGRNA